MKTASELQQELDDAHARIGDLEQRLTTSVVEQARHDRQVHAAAKKAAERQLQYRFDQYWRVALAEARDPLTGLVHRVRTLGSRPKKAQLDALLVAAEEAADALTRGQEEAGHDA